MIIVSVDRTLFALHTARGQVSFNPNNWLYPRAPRELIKFHSSVKSAVVSKRQTFEIFAHRRIHELGNFREPIEQGIVGMDVKMNRFFAGTLVALMLCISSLGVACDLSCGFPTDQYLIHAIRRSDGHSR